MIAWCEKREGYEIGDFGCGEALLAKAVGDRHTVHRFDHIAIDDSVIDGDMGHLCPRAYASESYARVGAMRTLAENVSSGAKTITPAGMPLASRLMASVGQVYGSKQITSRPGGV